MKTKDRDKFREFIRTIKEEQVGHWVEVARAVGVSEATISNWRRLPESQEPIKLGIINTLEKMEKAGNKDWRMYESKLKMLGLVPTQKASITLQDPRGEILKKYGLTSETEEAKG
jgi:hypothetical protein